MEHRQRLVEGFSSKYNVNRLVYWEKHGDIRGAITREKQIEGWVRAKKVALIARRRLLRVEETMTGDYGRQAQRLCAFGRHPEERSEEGFLWD